LQANCKSVEVNWSWTQVFFDEIFFIESVKGIAVNYLLFERCMDDKDW